MCDVASMKLLNVPIFDSLFIQLLSSLDDSIESAVMFNCVDMTTTLPPIGLMSPSEFN